LTIQSSKNVNDCLSKEMARANTAGEKLPAEGKLAHDAWKARTRERERRLEAHHHRWFDEEEGQECERKRRLRVQQLVGFDGTMTTTVGSFQPVR